MSRSSWATCAGWPGCPLPSVLLTAAMTMLAVPALLLAALLHPALGCCLEKAVGGVSYYLASQDTGLTPMYGCSEDCVYIRSSQPSL